MTGYVRRELSGTRLSQGDILQEVVVANSRLVVASGQPDRLDVSEISYPYVVVLTQECDLEQDFASRQAPDGKPDQCIPTILLAPAYLSESLREGTHLSELGYEVERINSTRWRPLTLNINERYHFLARGLQYGVPDLVVDFKHYFTLPRDECYSDFANGDHYVASLAVPYREHLSSRFCNYLSRIALP